MPKTMRAVDIHGGAGPASALFINASTPKPVPRDGDALVRVKAFGLNRMDIIQRNGNYPVPPQATRTLGVEFSGTIQAFGTGDHGNFKVGDEVFGLAYGGAYAEYIAVNSKMLLHRPPHLTAEQAAGVPETWITATQALHFVLGIQPGQTILWHAGASGVSIAGVQLSRAAGSGAVFATAGSDEKCRFVEKELGATAAFNYKTSPNWSEEILKATGGKGVDLIVDFVGADYFQQNIDALAKEGRMVLLGTLSGGVVSSANIGAILYKRLRIEGSTLRTRDLEYQGRLRDKLEEYLPQFESGKFKLFIDTVLPMEEVVKGHEIMEENKTLGKIVYTVS